MRIRLARLAAAAAIALATPAALAAQNLLTNPSWESGFAGWGTATSTGYTIVPPGLCIIPGGSGTGCLLLATPGTGTGFGFATQSVATTVGETYLATVRTAGNVAEEAVRAVLMAVNGAQSPRSEVVCLTPGASCLLSLTFTAIHPVTTLSIGVEGYAPVGVDPANYIVGGTGFDDAFLGIAPAVVTPEPATLALTAGGLLALAAAVGRRRRA